MHGKGSLLFPDGSKYVGEWRNGIQHGFGLLSISDGSTQVSVCLLFIVCYIINQTNLSSLVASVSALRLEAWGSIPGRVIPQTLKMGPNASPLGTQHQRLD